MRRFNPFILSTVSIAALIATPAFAQETQQDTAPPETLTSEQEIESGEDAQSDAGQPNTATADEAAITVTGSRIRSPNLESPLPVTSVGGEEFFETGDVSVGDKLAELPAIRSTFTQANSTRFLGTAGLNLLDLRGLGTARTLVLVNGRRHVGGDVLSTGVSVDVNTIPADLIERVDVVTGGNSAVYGSDAIAGVVNFVLKQDYDGFMIRGQGGQSKYGDANAYFVSALWGTNFADGRGNIAVNVEYARRDQAWGDERDWLRTVLTVVDSDPASATSDGIPDRTLNPDFRSVSFSAGGTVRIGGRTNTGAPAATFCGLDPQGNQYNCSFPVYAGRSTDPPDRSARRDRPEGQLIGGNGFGFFEGHSIQVTPQLDRYNINVLGHIEMSPAIVPFFEAKLSRTDSVGTGASGPFFISGGVLGDPLQFFSGTGNRERISLSNPFLHPDDAAFLRDSILASGVNNCNFAPLTNTDRARLANGTFRFCVQDACLRPSCSFRDARVATPSGLSAVFAATSAARGTTKFPPTMVSSRRRPRSSGNIDIQRFLLANDAVRDPTTGEIVCASQINPGRAFGYYPWFYYQYYGADYPGADPNAPARLANDIAQCVPINTLGGQFSQAQIDYLLLDTVAKGRASQLDLLAFISGDTSNLFELPGGPIGIVLGVEYRADDLYYQQDEQVSLGYTFYNAIPTFSGPKSKVKEAFGEIRLPIVKDVPFLNELEVSAAARVSDYSLGTTGSVWAWNVNANWSPFEGLRFRGNVARAVRAPNQAELLAPPGQNFSLFADPCDVNQVGAGTANRAANCIAAGIPAGTLIQYSSSVPFLSGGNPNLEAETSRSLTVGGVFTPTFIPGFSASVDYYKIKLKGAIQVVAAQTILNSCYDLPTINNPFCAQFERDPTGATANNGIPFGIVPNSLLAGPLNYAAFNARGLDFEFAYRSRIGNLGRIDTRLNWTHVLELTNFISPTDPDFGNRILSELGDPKDAFNWNTNFKTGRFTFGYQMRYVGRMVTNFYEDFFEFEGRPPQNEDFADKRWYPRRFYHDVRFAVDVGPKYNFYMGIDNLSNAKPPYATTGLGGGSAIYDAIGRFFYAGVKANF